MVLLNEQIDPVIDLMSERSRIFSARDIATYIGWEEVSEDIEESLSLRCKNHTLLRIEESPNPSTTATHYLGVEHVKRWWVSSTLRWAGTEITHVTSDQLAGAMSLAFASHRWVRPPSSLINTGRQWAMVTEGCVAGTFVFPWVSLIQCFPETASLLRFTTSSELTFPWLDSSLAKMTDEALNTISVRESEIVRLRFGLKNNQRRTLEEVGKLFGVTRERIRQIEAKVIRKLRHQSRIGYFYAGFAAEFVHSGGALLISDPKKIPIQLFLYKVLGLHPKYIKELGVGIVTSQNLSNYRDTLKDDRYSSNGDLKDIAAHLPFLSKADADYLSALVQRFKNVRITTSWTRPRMTLEALRNLGRAAHYQEIAELCNKLFPEKQTSIRSWHAALNLPSCDALGIVWIGRKGMYGLKEHGYARPEKDLFNTVAEIVEDMFSKTQQPVAEAVVISELSKYRRESKIASVKMALSFNDKIESVSPALYVPKRFKFVGNKDSIKPGYDIAAAFRAFSEPSDKDL